MKMTKNMHKFVETKRTSALVPAICLDCDSCRLKLDAQLKNI